MIGAEATCGAWASHLPDSKVRKTADGRLSPWLERSLCSYHATYAICCTLLLLNSSRDPRSHRMYLRLSLPNVPSDLPTPSEVPARFAPSMTVELIDAVLLHCSSRDQSSS